MDITDILGEMMSYETLLYYTSLTLFSLIFLKIFSEGVINGLPIKLGCHIPTYLRYTACQRDTLLIKVISRFLHVCISRNKDICAISLSRNKSAQKKRERRPIEAWKVEEVVCKKEQERKRLV